MQHPNLTSATIIKDSISSRGHRITTIKMVFPRYILAELNTHRMFNRNSASSRAIPFRKMVRSAIDNPFIPMAFQKDHSGMQGTEYLDPDLPISIKSFREILQNVFKYTDDDLGNSDEKVDSDIAGYIDDLLTTAYDGPSKQTPAEWWLWCRDQAVKSAILMASIGTTKQLCNRILEPFIYHTALITATEWENFFELRCPKYKVPYFEGSDKEIGAFESKKDFNNFMLKYGWKDHQNYSNEDFLKLNKGAGEIHIMDLAEKVYDAMNNSIPEKLSDGAFHIPFMDKETEQGIMDITPKPSMGHPEEDSEPAYASWLDDVYENMLKVSVARAARISYETLGDNPKIDYEADIKLHDDLLAMKHMSPFEHIGRAMTDEEYVENIRGKININDYASDRESIQIKDAYIPENNLGWNRTFNGFIQYRELVEQ